MSTTILHGDCRDKLKDIPDNTVQTCVTSPPYFGLRNYGVPGQIGLEPTPAAFVEQMVLAFREVRRVLRDDGTLWLNLGDSYTGRGRGGNPVDSPYYGRVGNNVQSAGLGKKETYGMPEKNLLGIPWRVAFALQDDGWILRSDIIWSKPNAMPESVTDRPTRAHEYLFLFSKQPRYYYNADAIKEPAVDGDPTAPRAPRGAVTPNAGRRDKQGDSGLRRYEGFNARWDGRDEPLTHRNKRSVWTVATTPYKEAHFATFPEALIEPCILAGSKPGDTVLDPFGGSGTTARVAERFGRNAILIELNPAYIELQERRTDGVQVDMRALLEDAA